MRGALIVQCTFYLATDDDDDDNEYNTPQTFPLIMLFISRSVAPVSCMCDSQSSVYAQSRRVCGCGLIVCVFGAISYFITHAPNDRPGAHPQPNIQTNN